MEFKGKVIVVAEKQSGVAKSTGNPWSKQSYVVENDDKYPKKMCFEVFGEDKINQFAIKVGEVINVLFDINAKEYQGRWYNSLTAWRVQREQQVGDQQAPSLSDDKDLPF